MTGFGRAHKEVNNREYIVEIRSVNHKYNDINIRMPRNISYFEEKIRKEVLATITRGKIVKKGKSFVSIEDLQKSI